MNLEKYNELLIKKNRVINLTAHKDFDSSWKYNVQDSLLFNEYITSVIQSPKGEESSDKRERIIKCLDIGSGAGAPAIPLKISFPQLDITMVDSVRKKVDFLNEVVKELELKHIRAIHIRIEDIKERNFDIVTARAVAPLNTLLEYSLPFLKIGGLLLAYKGKNVHEEITQAQNALNILGGTIESIIQENLDSETVRYLVVVKKVKPTSNSYPRGKNLPRTKPL